MFHLQLQRLDKAIWLIAIVSVLTSIFKLGEYYDGYGEDALTSSLASILVAFFSYFFYRLVFVVFGKAVKPYFSSGKIDLQYTKIAFDTFAILSLVACVYFAIGFSNDVVSEPIYKNIVFHFSPVCIAMYAAVREARRNLVD